MLKWKTEDIVVGTAYTEVLNDALAGMQGKGRIIRYVGSPTITGLSLRVYRDAEQIADVAVTIFTTTFRLLEINLPLAEGQLCKVGFNETAGGTGTYKFIIGYEESD